MRPVTCTIMYIKPRPYMRDYTHTTRADTHARTHTDTRHTHTHTHTLSLSLCLSLSHTNTHTLCVSLSHTLSLSLSHTHTNAHTGTHTPIGYKVLYMHSDLQACTQSSKRERETKLTRLHTDMLCRHIYIRTFCSIHNHTLSHYSPTHT